MKSVQVTFLSSIAGSDFPAALERQTALNLKLLDLKDGLWDQTIEQLDEPAAERVATLCRKNGVGVDCFSTGIGRARLADEAAFRTTFEPSLDRALRSARILHPRTIRLLVPMIDAAKGEAFARLQHESPWLIGVYREWVDRIVAAGFAPILENETHHCLFSSTADVAGFFTALDRPAARYTYDVQNLWQNGTFPSLEVYSQVRPFIGALHLKGGRSDVPSGPLTTAAALDEASWPVLEMVHAVIADEVTPVICLNPSHGRQPPDWNVWETACRDLAFLRREIPRIE